MVAIKDISPQLEADTQVDSCPYAHQQSHQPTRRAEVAYQLQANSYETPAGDQKWMTDVTDPPKKCKQPRASVTVKPISPHFDTA